MPFRGDVRSAPVPGCVDGWLALHERFGRLPARRRARPGDRATPSDGFPAVAAPRLSLLPSPTWPAPRAATSWPTPAPDGATAPPARRRPRAARRSSADGRRRLLRRRVRRGPPRARARASTPTTTSPAPGRLGRAARRSTCGATTSGRCRPTRRATSRWPAPAIAERARPARRPGRRPLGPPARRGRPRWPATTGPRVLHDGADGARAARPATSSPTGARRIDPDAGAPPSRAAPAAGGTIYLCAVDGDGMGVSPHPVERVRASAATSSCPAPASSCTTAASGSRSSPATRPSTARVAGRRTPSPRPRHPTRRRAAGGARHDGRRQPAPGAAPAARPPAPAGEDPGHDHRRPALGARPRRRHAASTCGTAPVPPTCASRPTPPPRGPTACRAGATTSRRAGPDIAGFGHAHLIDLTPEGPVGAADPDRSSAPRSLPDLDGLRAPELGEVRAGASPSRR